MSDKAVFKVRIEGTAEAVWRELSKQDELQGAFFNNWMEAKAFAPGEPFRMLTPSRAYVGVVGRILQVEPPRLYVHTMRFTNIEEPELTVRHEIVPVAGGVEYTMTLTDLVPGSKSAKQAAQGMKMIGATLRAIVEDGRPSLGMRLLHRIFALTERFSPDTLRSEHWPLGRGLKS